MCGTYQINGILRAVDGRDGSSLFDVTDPSMRVIGGAQIAIANIDDDPMVEIVTCGSDADLIGSLIAFEHDGTFKWRTTDPRVSCTQAAPSIADRRRRNVEVFVRYTVVNGADGSVAWHNGCARRGAVGAQPVRLRRLQIDADGRLG
jgi:catabolite regulation protein CreA